jgi:hypothetical protein
MRSASWVSERPISPITSTCGKYTCSTAACEYPIWITVGPPGRITNGGFSVTSWPMVTITSAWSIAVHVIALGQRRGAHVQA